MLLSTSLLIATTPPSTTKQIEALIEGRLFDHARRARHLRGRMSGVDLSGLDLAYRSAHHSEFDFLGSLCDTCSDFPRWLESTTAEGFEPGLFCLGQIRNVFRRSPSCRLCRVVWQSIVLMLGIADDIILVGLSVSLHPRGKAAFDNQAQPPLNLLFPRHRHPQPSTTPTAAPPTTQPSPRPTPTNTPPTHPPPSPRHQNPPPNHHPQLEQHHPLLRPPLQRPRHSHLNLPPLLSRPLHQPLHQP
ncbi:hypothetical protein QBC34DRAFT_418203 [Podospora aff. communis PSN243]|uniref:Uncharacterized protein n=1 Tax=Podospora aff. communis PSN243 TaxID=3040156 RepID=A0AAV9G248_9PEZI|nr:hypothetical protein QBC34DRAFT_418203 [Podospora aff. communis PSN243]